MNIAERQPETKYHQDTDHCIEKAKAKRIDHQSLKTCLGIQAQDRQGDDDRQHSENHHPKGEAKTEDDGEAITTQAIFALSGDC